MISLYLPTVLLLLVSSIEANLIPRTTITSYSNSSSTTTSKASATTPKCCFVVQDTVSQEWWQQTRYQYAVANLTSITTYITKYPNTTSTNYKTNVYKTTQTFSTLVGVNPITNFLNHEPEPTEVAHRLNGTQAITTAGVTIHSPAAFYVYNSVKIITAAAVTDDNGNAVCATASTFTDGNDGPETFTPINSNAQAYFGGVIPVEADSVPTLTITTTETFTTTYAEPDVKTSTGTRTITETKYGTALGDLPTGTVISLVTPFIYQPVRGAKGKTGIVDHCDSSGGTEEYGYVPQTLLDFLIQNKQYSAQYPGLENCLPGGPSILPGKQCGFVVTSALNPVGGDLTEGTIVYVTPPGIALSPTPKPEVRPGEPQEKPKGGPESQVDGGKPASAPKPADPPASDPPKPFKTAESDASLGAIINSIMGGAPLPIPDPSPKGNPIVIPSATVIAVASAPPGLTGQITTVNGAPLIVVPGPTTIPAPAPLPAGAENIGSATVIGGSPYVVIPGPTNIPLSNAPAGIAGSTTVINGVPYLAIPGPATYAAPQPAGGAGSIGSTTMIGGVPFVVYPGPTNIPLSNAPAGLSGTTTTIDGVPYLVVPAPTTLAAPPAGEAGSIGSTTLINGTPYVVIPGPTMIPAAGAPSGARGASTTLVNGTPYLIIPSQTTVALSPSKTAGLDGQLTVIIDGSSRLIIAGPTTIPVNPDFPISGKTTVIDGTTMVVVSSATTIPAKTSAKTTSSRSSSRSTTRASSTAGPAASDAAPSSDGTRRLELNACLLGLGLMISFLFL